MAPELRSTGISVVGDVPWGTHFCSFYETKQDLLDILIPFFKTGLESNEFCLWIVSSSELLTMQEASNALQKALPDLHRYLAEKSIELIGDDWFLNGGSFDFRRVANRFKEKSDEALSRGYVGMRVNGSPAWLETNNPKELRSFEAEIEQLFPHERIIASCTYSIGSTTADFLLDIARRHQFAIARRNGIWDIVETPELTQAKAEIDRLNAELEQRVIERTKRLEAKTARLRAEIEERKEAEEALRQSEERFAAFMDNLPGYAWMKDLEGRYVYINNTFLQLRNAVGKTDAELWPAEIASTYRANDNQVIQTKHALQTIEPFPKDPEQGYQIVSKFPILDQDGAVVMVGGASVDITERIEAEEQLKATSEQLRALSARLQSAREEESKRIAREIHDELGGALTTWKWDLEEICDVISEPLDSSQVATLRTKVEAMTKLTETTLDTVRKLASELRPTALELGLLEGIEWQLLQFENRTGIKVRLKSSVEKVDLDDGQAIAVFRILQEALTNIQRHAQATKATITVNQASGQFLLMIQDNGRGFTKGQEIDRQSLGLLGMRERVHLVGGEINIESVAGKGTKITVQVPLVGSGRLRPILESDS